MNRTGIILITILLVIIAFLGFQQYRATTQVSTIVKQISNQDNGLVIDRGDAALWSGKVVLKDLRYSNSDRTATIRKAEFELGFTDMVRLAFFGPESLLRQMRGVEMRVKELRFEQDQMLFSAEEIQVALFGLKNVRQSVQMILKNEVPASDARFVISAEKLYLGGDSFNDFISIPETEISGNLNYLQKAIQFDKIVVNDGTSENRIEGFGFVPLQYGPLSDAWKTMRISVRRGSWERVKLPVSDEIGDAELVNVTFSAEIDQLYPLENVKQMSVDVSADSIIIHPPNPLTMPYQPLVAFVGYNGARLPGVLQDFQASYRRGSPFSYQLSLSTTVADIEAQGQVAINEQDVSESLFAGMNDVSVTNIEPGMVRAIQQIGTFFGKSIPIQENAIQLQMYGSVTNPGFSKK